MRFSARLLKLRGKKFEQFDLTNERDAHAARERLAQIARKVDWWLPRCNPRNASAGHRHRSPRPRCNRKPRASSDFPPVARMRIAQGLYEGVAIGDEGTVGLITYMRTDSVNLANDAIAELRKVILRDFGAKALPESPNLYRAKSKNAQEAHEAIRPDVGAAHAGQRCHASERRSAQALRSDLETRSGQPDAARHPQHRVGGSAMPAAIPSFRASGTTVVDPGFLAVYEEGRDQKNAEDEDENRKLPALKIGEAVPLADILAEQHFTEPPPRYSEASLVKTLEEYGIGRPSTYASIIQTLLNREYAVLDSRRFRPTDVGRAVAKFLAGHFAQYVDYDFTAKLEDELDAVSRGEEDWVPLLRKFWTPFKNLVEEKTESVDRSEASGSRALGIDPASGKPVTVRLGRYGPMAQIGTKDDAEKPRFASLRPGQSIHTITLEDALQLFRLPRELGSADDGEAISVGIGRFGPFVKHGSTYASLKPADDPYTIELARAQQLLHEKAEAIRTRVIASFRDGTIQVLNGRYGPYITDGEKNARIPRDREPASLTEADCAELLAAAPVKPKRGGRSGKAAAKSAAPAATAQPEPPRKIAAKKPAAKKSAAKKSAVKKAGAKKDAG